MVHLSASYLVLAMKHVDSVLIRADMVQLAKQNVQRCFSCVMSEPWGALKTAGDLIGTEMRHQNPCSPQEL